MYYIDNYTKDSNMTEHLFIYFLHFCGSKPHGKQSSVGQKLSDSEPVMFATSIIMW